MASKKDMEGGVSPDPAEVGQALLDVLTKGYKQKKVRKAPTFDEARIALDLMGKGKPLAGIKCIGKDWYRYSMGAWEAVDRALLGRVALDQLSLDFKTARNAGSVLDHVEMSCQVPPANLRGFYREKIDGDGNRSFLLNVRNGVLEVFPDEGGVHLREHSPEHGFTLQAAAAYDEKAECARFTELLGQQLPDEEDHELVQCFAGSVLCPTAQFEAAMVSYGPGGYGKSKLVYGIANTLASDEERGELQSLVSNLSIAALCDRKGYSLPKLGVAALNLGTEVTTVDLEDSSNFKALISGERVEARAIYGAPVALRSTSKFWFLANNPPQFKNGSTGEGRRLRFLQFDQAPKKIDTELLQKLYAEREGIFKWMVAGLIKLMQRGGMPHGGKKSRSVWERFDMANDSVTWFVQNKCQLEPAAFWKKEWALNEFAQFLEDQGLSHRHAEDWFFKRLYQKFSGVGQVRRSEGNETVRYLTGIRLKREDEA